MDDATGVAGPIMISITLKLIKVITLLISIVETTILCFFMKMTITDKKVVKINYTGKLTDGTVFDSSVGKEPLQFIFGVGMIIPGLEEGIKGLKVGDKKTVEIPADKAYGQRNDAAIQEVPKDQFPKEIELKVGLQLMAQGPQGVLPVTIADIKENTVTVDFNPPLAGKDLTFDVEIVEVRDATEEELSHGHVHGPGGVEHGDEAANDNSSDDDKKAA